MRRGRRGAGRGRGGQGKLTWAGPIPWHCFCTQHFSHARAPPPAKSMGPIGARPVRGRGASRPRSLPLLEDDEGGALAMNEERFIRYLHKVLAELQGVLDCVDVPGYSSQLQDLTKKLSESHSQEQLTEVTGWAVRGEGRIALEQRCLARASLSECNGQRSS